MSGMHTENSSMQSNSKGLRADKNSEGPQRGEETEEKDGGKKKIWILDSYSDPAENTCVPQTLLQKILVLRTPGWYAGYI